MISIQNLKYTMEGREVLSGFSLEIQRGEKVLIRGRSGSGKTSLFRLLLGFDRPGAGEIHINGRPLDKNHIRSIRNQTFYLSQDVDLPAETGQHLIGRLERLKLLPLVNSLHRFLDLLSLSPSLLDKQISVLSGGERQRLGLLIGCLTDRHLWLLDEPTSALDDTMKQVVAGHIMDSDKTVIVISHDRVWHAPGRIRIVDWR